MSEKTVYDMAFMIYENDKSSIIGTCSQYHILILENTEIFAYLVPMFEDLILEKNCSFTSVTIGSFITISINP